MVAAIIPACNAAKHIRRVLDSVSRAGADQQLVIVNGSDDQTFGLALAQPDRGVTVVHFTDRLGIDLPRSVGAWFAAQVEPEVILFVDGDMSGAIAPGLADLIKTVRGGADMALTDCYSNPPRIQGLARDVIRYREKLNRALGLFDRIGYAIPSHGPHAVSGRFLRSVPLADLAVPPAALAIAVQQGLRIEVGAGIDHLNLGSPLKDYPHSRQIADTIIGDCLEGLCLAQGEPRRRTYEGRSYLGYHPERRFDILTAVRENKTAGLYHVVRPEPTRD